MRSLVLTLLPATLVGCALLTDLDGFSGGSGAASSDNAGDAKGFDITGGDADAPLEDGGLPTNDGAPAKRGVDFATGQGLPTRVAVDPDGVFFLDSSPTSGGVRLRGRDGGVVTDYSGPCDAPVAMQIDADVVRWTLTSGALMFRKRTESNAQLFSSVNDVSTSFAYDKAADWWVTTNPNSGKLRYCTFGTCGDAVVSRTAPREIVNKNGSFYWLENDSSGGGLLQGCSAGNCSGTLDAKATGLGTARGFAVDATEAYVAADDKIVDVTIATKTVATLASGLASPSAVAVYGSVFFTTAGDGKVWKLPAGGQPILVGEGLVHPSALAVDATGIYVASYGDGRIVRFDL